MSRLFLGAHRFHLVLAKPHTKSLILVYRLASSLTLSTLLFGYLGKHHWVLDLFSHFRLYNLGALILLIGFGILLKQSKTIVGLGLIALSISLSIIPYYQTSERTCNGKKPLRLISINLLSENSDYNKVSQFIRESNPDVLVLLEYTQAWNDALAEMENDFIFVKKEIRDDNFGIAVYSKTPVDSSEILRFSKYEVPTYLLSLTHDSAPLSIVATHAIPPFYPTLFRLRTAQFIRIGEILKGRPGEHIVIGDFNCSGFSPNFRDFLADGHLRDSRMGFGIQPSWFARTSLISIDLDHALVSPGLTVRNRATGRPIGSDHLPIILDVCTSTE